LGQTLCRKPGAWLPWRSPARHGSWQTPPFPTTPFGEFESHLFDAQEIGRDVTNPIAPVFHHAIGDYPDTPGWALPDDTCLLESLSVQPDGAASPASMCLFGTPTGRISASPLSSLVRRQIALQSGSDEPLISAGMLACSSLFRICSEMLQRSFGAVACRGWPFLVNRTRP